MKKVKGFSFNTVDDKDIIDYLDEQTNQSGYIKELIRKDMKQNNIEEIVKKQIEKYLENLNLTTKKEETVQIDTAEVMNILNL